MQLSDLKSSAEKGRVSLSCEVNKEGDSRNSKLSLRIQNRISVTPRRSSALQRAQIKIIGMKDVHVLFFLIGLGVFWSAIYWSFTLGNERRALPSNTSFHAASAWEAVLQINGTFVCKNNITLPLNLTESNKADLNTTNTFTFYEIAKCVGWSQAPIFLSVARYLTWLSCWTLLTIIIWYMITDMRKFHGKTLVKKLILIWLIAVVVYLVARTVGMNMLESYLIFLSIYCIVTPLVLSRKLLKCLSIEYKIKLKWWGSWLICIVATNILTSFPKYGGNYVDEVRVVFPLILMCLDFFACWAVELCFNEHKYNREGQAMLLALYIWRMEDSRFDCFIALFLGWKSGNVPFQNVIWNSVFSVLGEIWTHTGIREAIENWIYRNMDLMNWKSDWPEIRLYFGSIRGILEWVLPAINFSILSFLEWRRDYIVVPKDNIINQQMFFTSVKLFEHLIDIVLVYYTVEAVSLFLCWIIAKTTGHKEISLLGSLRWSSIIVMGVGLVALTDVNFNIKFWSALVDIN